MIERDGPAIVRAAILSHAPLSTAVGGRVYAEAATPPAGYTPADGAAIVIAMRGGADDYTDALARHSYQIKVYGGGASVAAQVTSARAVSRLLWRYLHDHKGGAILHAERETLPAALLEPGAGWAYTLEFWQFLITHTQEGG